MTTTTGESGSAVKGRPATGRLSLRGNLSRRYREFGIIARDPVLLVGLLIAGLFILTFVFFPIARVVIRAFEDEDGVRSIEYFARYADPYYAQYLWRSLRDTMVMGLLTATLGTLLGFIFAYTIVRCSPPGKRWVHILALIPIVSPPFAIAMATILLFGRNGLVTAKFFGWEFTQEMNDIYGMDGLVFVQTITFFSVSYLIIRAMMERLNPAMEEAAHSLGASKFHIFRTITLPLLIPGLAASFLLLFVESLADLGNPLLISGNVNVLSAQIFLAVAGEFDYQKASTLAVILLIPTLIVFIVQRYWVSRRSYVSVTGKPAGGQILVKEPITRWTFILITYAVLALILLLYLSIVVGSFSKVWGINYTPTLAHWKMMLNRGNEAIMDTTFLSLVATPIAVLLGLTIAFLVVRKIFSGKDVLDFGSNLGAAVPGTILGIGFILAFVVSPWLLVFTLYIVMALFMTRTAHNTRRKQWGVLAAGSALVFLVWLSQQGLGEAGVMYLLGALYMIVAAYFFFKRQDKRSGWLLMGMGFYLMMANLIVYVARPIAALSRQIDSSFWSDAVFQLSDYIQVFFQVPQAILMIPYVFLGTILVLKAAGRERLILAIVLLGLGGALTFVGDPLAMVGTAFIILFAYAVRSLPASVRSGVASLQQIDPAIDEASNSLGADAQYTFRKVTLPLVTPALLAGLIFAFTRHMTSLSAIIFLVSPRWRIVTASILSEWEQGGVSLAAAYATVIIALVLIAIGVMYIITHRVLRGRGDVDLTLGA
ncbi:MAG: iron ABC transporter permease [Chloroflexota bacterium]|nr:MAG: iron ABC transporter permease [Chloroflexota bacterium]